MTAEKSIWDNFNKATEPFRCDPAFLGLLDWAEEAEAEYRALQGTIKRIEMVLSRTESSSPTPSVSVRILIGDIRKAIKGLKAEPQKILEEA